MPIDISYSRVRNLTETLTTREYGPGSIYEIWLAKPCPKLGCSGLTASCPLTASCAEIANEPILHAALQHRSDGAAKGGS